MNDDSKGKPPSPFFVPALVEKAEDPRQYAKRLREVLEGGALIVPPPRFDPSGSARPPKADPAVWARRFMGSFAEPEPAEDEDLEAERAARAAMVGMLSDHALSHPLPAPRPGFNAWIDDIIEDIHLEPLEDVPQERPEPESDDPLDWDDLEWEAELQKLREED